MLVGETIAAIATAPGRGGVAVVRVSGPEAMSVAERLTGRPARVGRACLVRIRQPDRQTVLDEGLLLAFRAPHSYTGEDVVEFQCHGGTVVPRRVLSACLSAGARLARRGEFTQRAFLNGKLDYDQAESVLDLIDARTDRAADAALEGLSGRRQRDCRALYEEALAISTDVEHALDIDEGELEDGFFDGLKDRIAALRARVDAQIRRAREGKILRQGALVVLAGPPNAGKSSLMNALLEENRAIVSDVPGTTRDSIEEWLDLDGWPIRLVDTAGLRETDDAVEAEGVRRAESLTAQADVVVELVPAGSVPRLRAALAVTSKCDLTRGPGLNVSTKTGEGLADMKAAIVARLAETFAAGPTVRNDVPDAAQATLVEVAAVLEGLSPEPDLVLWGNVLRNAAVKLGEQVGAVYSSDMLERLFTRFCVGK